MKKAATNTEMELMHIFWSAGRPLSSLDILKSTQRWSGTYVHVMLRSLLNKDMILECGTVKSGKQYARQFIPSVSREEYEISVLSSKNIDAKSVLKIAAGLVEK